MQPGTMHATGTGQVFAVVGGDENGKGALFSDGIEFFEQGAKCMIRKEDFVIVQVRDRGAEGLNFVVFGTGVMGSEVMDPEHERFVWWSAAQCCEGEFRIAHVVSFFFGQGIHMTKYGESLMNAGFFA